MRRQDRYERPEHHRLRPRHCALCLRHQDGVPPAHRLPHRALVVLLALLHPLPPGRASLLQVRLLHLRLQRPLRKSPLVVCRKVAPSDVLFRFQVLRLAYNVLLVLFLFAGAINAVFSAPTSQAKVLSDVMSTLTGPIFENALASMEIK